MREILILAVLAMSGCGYKAPDAVQPHQVDEKPLSNEGVERFELVNRQDLGYRGDGMRLNVVLDTTTGREYMIIERYDMASIQLLALPSPAVVVQCE